MKDFEKLYAKVRREERKTLKKNTESFTCHMTDLDFEYLVFNSFINKINLRDSYNNYLNSNKMLKTYLKDLYFQCELN